MSPMYDDTDDDVTLRPRREDDDDYPPSRASRGGMEHTASAPVDREFTLNTGVVLALFFALALLCAVFFGFGYSIGHKSAPAAIVAADGGSGAMPDTSSTPVVSVAPKPSPGSAATPGIPSYVGPTGADRSTTSEAPKPAAHEAAPVVRPTPPPTTTSASAAPATTATAAATRPAPVVRTPPPATSAAPVPAAAPAAGTGGPGTYVQVAAVSHQEDADVLLSALRRRGYAVLTRNDLGDHLIHVQIGPFSARKDAEDMRKRLAGDGYNAFLK